MAKTSTKKRFTYRTLRAKLLERGVNLKRFAEQRRLSPSTVYSAAKGERKGVDSVKILRELEALAA